MSEETASTQPAEYTRSAARPPVQVTTGLPDALVESVSQRVMQQVDAKFDKLIRMFRNNSSSSSTPTTATSSTQSAAAPPISTSATSGSSATNELEGIPLVAYHCWAVRMAKCGCMVRGLSEFGCISTAVMRKKIGAHTGVAKPPSVFCLVTRHARCVQVRCNDIARSGRVEYEFGEAKRE